jgi:uncharacterized protein YceH (UPF0502 family)
VLGCLLEKQQTTPDSYPLTLNSLRLACNQSTSRNPVVEYDEATVRDAAQRLGQRGLARMTSYHGSRTAKYRHLVDDALGIAPDERALLCVLMLRGPQTLGELKQRSERLHSFADLSSVQETLDRLTDRGLGRWIDRHPGQKETRYTHLLGVASDDAMPIAVEAPGDLAAEVARLQHELDSLRRDIAALRDELGSAQPDSPDQ